MQEIYSMGKMNCHIFLQKYLKNVFQILNATYY